MNGPKPGYLTTEWWGKNVLQVISIALAVYVAQNPGNLTADQQNQIMVGAGVIVPPLMEVLYGVNRSWVKRAYAHGTQQSPGRRQA